MSKRDAVWATVAAILVAVIIAVGAFGTGKASVQAEAAERGYGQWFFNPNGRLDFRWLEPCAGAQEED